MIHKNNKITPNDTNGLSVPVRDTCAPVLCDEQEQKTILNPEFCMLNSEF